MLRRRLVILAPLILAAGPALAAKPKPKPAEAAAPYVDLLPVALPVVVQGRLVNYVFVSVRLDLSKDADASKLRAKEPLFRDALVRAGHRTPFTKADDYLALDEAKLKAALLRDAGAIAGGGVVRSVTILKSTPKRRTGVPRPRPAPDA